MIKWYEYPKERVSACFYLVFVRGFSAQSALDATSLLEEWQLDELAENGHKAWKYLEGEILEAA